MILKQFIGIYFISICNFAPVELFTALDELECLLETRKRVIDDVDFYISTENTSLAILKRYLDLIQTEYVMASKDVINYTENPLNAFILIKRLTSDLRHMNNVIKAERENVKNVTKKHEDMRYPERKDLIGAVSSIMNLQEVYLLDAKDIANGKLNYFQSSVPMTGSDCYELARILFDKLEPKFAIAWMEEALRKLYEEKFPNIFKAVDIMEFINYGHYMLGDQESALYWTKKILTLDRNHSRSRQNLKRLQKETDKSNTKGQQEVEAEKDIQKEIMQEEEDVK